VVVERRSGVGSSGDPDSCTQRPCEGLMVRSGFGPGLADHGVGYEPIVSVIEDALDGYERWSEERAPWSTTSCSASPSRWKPCSIGSMPARSAFLIPRPLMA